MQFKYPLSGDPLSLDRIRSVLTRLEDIIIFGLVERARFANSPEIYQKGGLEELRGLGFEGSWLDWLLVEIEAFHGTSAKRKPHPPTPIIHFIGSSLLLCLVRLAGLFCT